MQQDLTKIGNHLPHISQKSRTNIPVSTSNQSSSSSKNTTSTSLQPKPTKSTGTSPSKNGVSTLTNGRKKNWLTKSQLPKLVTNNEKRLIARLLQYKTVQSVSTLTDEQCNEMLHQVNVLRDRLESFEGASSEEIAVLMHNLALVIRSALPGADEPNVGDREAVLKHYASTLSTIPFPILQRAFQHLRKTWKYKTFPKIADVLEPINDEMQEIESMYNSLQHLEKILNVRLHGFRGSS